MRDKKTDNAHFRTKLELRRHMLRKFHSQGPIRVMDCCQGDGLLWGRLLEEFDLDSYWGMDVKKKRGRLKVDSSRVLSRVGWSENVIDVDVYGRPWKHWFAILKSLSSETCPPFPPLTVFLTVGLSRVRGGGVLSKEELVSLGVDRLKIPPSILANLNEASVKYCIGEVDRFDLQVTYCVEGFPSSNARYLGLRLEDR